MRSLTRRVEKTTANSPSVLVVWVRMAMISEVCSSFAIRIASPLTPYSPARMVNSVMAKTSLPLREKRVRSGVIRLARMAPPITMVMAALTVIVSVAATGAMPLPVSPWNACQKIQPTSAINSGTATRAVKRNALKPKATSRVSTAPDKEADCAKLSLPPSA